MFIRHFGIKILKKQKVAIDLYAPTVLLENYEMTKEAYNEV
jgi:hypothetical protein